MISFDEMKIQSDLVFDKHSNELIGFVDLGDEVSNVAVFDKPTTITTHVLAFMVRGIASDLKYILGYFSTENLTSYQIMPIFWKAVSILKFTGLLTFLHLPDASTFSLMALIWSRQHEIVCLTPVLASMRD